MRSEPILNQPVPARTTNFSAAAELRPAAGGLRAAPGCYDAVSRAGPTAAKPPGVARRNFARSSITHRTGERNHGQRPLTMYVGEALVGEGNEIAHIDLLIGTKDGPVGAAFANALANQSHGHTNLLAVLRPT